MNSNVDDSNAPIYINEDKPIIGPARKKFLMNKLRQIKLLKGQETIAFYDLNVFYSTKIRKLENNNVCLAKALADQRQVSQMWHDEVCAMKAEHYAVRENALKSYMEQKRRYEAAVKQIRDAAEPLQAAFKEFFQITRNSLAESMTKVNTAEERLSHSTLLSSKEVSPKEHFIHSVIPNGKLQDEPTTRMTLKERRKRRLQGMAENAKGEITQEPLEPIVEQSAFEEEAAVERIRIEIKEENIAAISKLSPLKVSEAEDSLQDTIPVTSSFLSESSQEPRVSPKPEETPSDLTERRVEPLKDLNLVAETPPAIQNKPQVTDLRLTVQDTGASEDNGPLTVQNADAFKDNVHLTVQNTDTSKNNVHLAVQSTEASKNIALSSISNEGESSPNNDKISRSNSPSPKKLKKPQIDEEDPLEGSSWMYMNNRRGAKRRCPRSRGPPLKRTSGMHFALDSSSDSDEEFTLPAPEVKKQRKKTYYKRNKCNGKHSSKGPANNKSKLAPKAVSKPSKDGKKSVNMEPVSSGEMHQSGNKHSSSSFPVSSAFSPPTEVKAKCSRPKMLPKTSVNVKNSNIANSQVVLLNTNRKHCSQFPLESLECPVLPQSSEPEGVSPLTTSVKQYPMCNSDTDSISEVPNKKKVGRTILGRTVVAPAKHYGKHFDGSLLSVNGLVLQYVEPKSSPSDFLEEEKKEQSSSHTMIAGMSRNPFDSSVLEESFLGFDPSSKGKENVPPDNLNDSKTVEAEMKLKDVSVVVEDIMKSSSSGHETSPSPESEIKQMKVYNCNSASPYKRLHERQRKRTEKSNNQTNVIKGPIKNKNSDLPNGRATSLPIYKADILKRGKKIAKCPDNSSHLSNLAVASDLAPTDIVSSSILCSKDTFNADDAHQEYPITDQLSDDLQDMEDTDLEEVDPLSLSPPYKIKHNKFEPDKMFHSENPQLQKTRPRSPAVIHNVMLENGKAGPRRKKENLLTFKQPLAIKSTRSGRRKIFKKIEIITLT